MAFDAGIIQQVWDNARVAADQDAAEWRVDECGAWMHRRDYGRENSDFGWKIENVSPGGPETTENLRAFNIANSFDCAQGRPRCRALADHSGQNPWEHASGPRNKSVGAHKA